jgi:hypothetical protein
MHSSAEPLDGVLGPSGMWPVVHVLACLARAQFLAPVPPLCSTVAPPQPYTSCDAQQAGMADVITAQACALDES